MEGIMLFHFRKQFPRLHHYWDKYLEFQQVLEVPSKTVLVVRLGYGCLVKKTGGAFLFRNTS